MKSHFTSEFFIQNRAALRKALGTDAPIIITGNGQMQRGSDEQFEFHQDSGFWYLTGLSNPDLTLVMLKNETYLMVPTLTYEREAFDGTHDTAYYTKRSGIDQVLNDKAGWQKLRQILQTADTAAVLASPPAYMKRHGLYTLPYRRRLVTKLRRTNPRLTLQDVRTELAVLRSVKQPAELAALQSAIDITTQTLQEVVDSSQFLEATHEYQLEAAITYGFRLRGAESHAFTPIVGAGKHTTTLHHMGATGPIEPGDAIIIDIGAVVEHYAADVARTVSRRPLTGRYAEVFHAVTAVQDFAISQIKPGVMPLDYEKAVEAYMGEQLLKLGVITDATRDNIRHYFPHATSHFLGLDAHDAGDYRAPWQENMVITCEPGIYLPEEGIGVRIEDDILITADGAQSLSSACPRELTKVQ